MTTPDPKKAPDSERAKADIDIRQGDLLIKELEESNADFAQKADALIADIENDIGAAKKEADEIDHDLSLFERDMVEKIDDAVEEFVRSNNKEG